MPTRTASVWSATSRYSWHMTAPTCGPTRTSSSWTLPAGRPWWPACRPTSSARRASAGATRSTAGPAGPGAALFEAVEAALGRVPVIVEDLGLITPEVVLLRDRLGYPGMKVLQFAFGDDATNPYLPHNYTQDCVVYTGTHDNDTTVGWFASLPEAERHNVRRYLGTHGDDIAWDLIRCALASVAD